ncbi:MAG: N-formylglutamate amidohydrolase [Aequoribacter sp.]|jgi:N-formylglutamate amidohydrolase|uniref:N-formylglutamate amidohydrolase n=1 Tax=Aequoribacter sp. TaxID=2847771 RepID=UPI003C36A835
MWPTPLLPLVLHIPHSGTSVPSATVNQFVNQELLQQNMNALTDWFTDELFKLPGASTVCTPVSRVVLDTERFTDDAKEPAARFGQGMIYTHGYNGEQLRRELSDQERAHLLENYYAPWHLTLEANIHEHLQEFGFCVVIDCHSFPNEQLPTETDQTTERPDICIGTHATNTPCWLTELASREFTKHGLSAALNQPFAGALLPDAFKGDPRVLSLMIEVNRDLYLRSDNLHEPKHKSQNFAALQIQLQHVLLKICAEFKARGITT